MFLFSYFFLSLNYFVYRFYVIVFVNVSRIVHRENRRELNHSKNIFKLNQTVLIYSESNPTKIIDLNIRNIQKSAD